MAARLRCSDSSTEELRIYYNSRGNLLAHGVISSPTPRWTPDPFPGRFVLDRLS
jgi:hypothetical protein